jgi:hypothetical protein
MALCGKVANPVLLLVAWLVAAGLHLDPEPVIAAARDRQADVRDAWSNALAPQLGGDDRVSQAAVRDREQEAQLGILANAERCPLKQRDLVMVL